ncbi:related to Metal homeostasis factor ATX2 [Saccharomycodes ludwigii]|uniref:Related to Metal homeostasis factor ATX2 n=1 Tax=Saccharomycodes ludwigii TaxID=36035 RepID=A0A376B852_9ASCO|nr:hypothetical protein SCDLUD_005290 [Saccharomycodes ludwigii]KAH3898943.1 hypothetical protein SCDLUD_005290 [Saccharomycodes ludwigii]SSD60842.1 related to Metal homeostasis factor ATX2 [Saccharomycodes ludwigii]
MDTNDNDSDREISGASISELLLTALLFHVATFLIGMIPLMFYKKWKEQQYNPNSKINFIFKYLSQFGIGMLLGTSFMLVIPEGVYSVIENGGNVGLNILTGFLIVYLLDNLVVHRIIKNRKINTELIPDAESSFSSFQIEDDNFQKKRLNSYFDAINFWKSMPIILENNVVFALVIHGISDGVSLGAATTTQSLKFVMYIAIIIHKIPAVLSLTSLMISKQKLPYLEIVSNLWAFAFSTPLGYLIVGGFCSVVKNNGFMTWFAADLLLISGGSLLYASFTAFSGNEEVEISSQESYDPNNVSEMDFQGNAEEKADTDHGLDALFVCIGTSIPTIISFFIKED